MPQNSVGGVSVSIKLDDKDAMQQLAKLRRKIEDTQKALAEKRAQRDSIAAEMEKAEVAADKARQRVKQLQAQLAAASPDARAGIRAKLTTANADLREQTKNLDALRRQWQKLDDDIASGEKNLEGMTMQAENLATQVKASSGAMSALRAAAAKATTAMHRGFARLGRVITRAFWFTTILRGLRAIREYLRNLLLSFPDIRQAISEIKGNLLTAAQPIFERLIPAVQHLLHILVQVSAVLADITAKIFGTTASQAQEGAKALNAQADAYKNAGSAAKKASKQLASFDEINKLGGEESTTGSGGGSSSSTAPTFNTDFSGQLASALEEIELLVETSLLALGAILTFTGVNVPLGVTLMAFGAAAVYSALRGDTEALKQSLEGQIGDVLLLISGALLVLGTILAFSGANIPLGIALMAIGAAGIAAEAALNWEALKEKLQGPIGEIVVIASAALLVLGAILAFSGAALPLGIALMVLGAAGLAAEIALNWETIKQKLQGPLGEITAIVSASLLVLGAVLTFSGANLPLGIGLMIAGAAGLATVAALNWTEIKAYIKENVSWTDALLLGALLVLGAVLTFSGANLPLGIGLMIAGAAGLATVAALNWETIKQRLQGPLGEITAIVSAALLELGAVLTFSGANLPLGIGLMIAGAAGLATVAALNWDKIKIILTDKFAGIAALISAGMLVLGVILTIAGILPLGIALIVAGTAGLLTVPALNWDAIKEKIADVWNGIKQWWQAHVAPVFTAEWWAEKFASISEGLKQKVKDGVNAAIDLFNQFIDWINQKMNISWSGFNLFGQEIIPAGSFQLLTLPRIPQLATGAVIPPNREFLALLGDQKSGTNIEAPLETIVQAFRQALGERGGASRTVILQVDKHELGRVTFDVYNTESQRIGMSLSSGGGR